MKRFVLALIGVAAFVAALWIGWTFRSGNSTVVEVDLIWAVLPSVELWQLIVGAMGAGGLIVGVGVGFAWLRARLLNRRYRSMVRRLEAELHQMRSLPLSGTSDPGLPQGGLGDEPKRSASGRS